MRLARYLLLPAALAFLFGGAETALTCCGPDFVKLPTPVPSGIIRGNQFFAVTADGKLLAADVTDHKVKQFPDLAKLGPMLDARGDTVCVTAGQKLLLVCVSTGKVCRELQIDGVIRSFGFAGDNHLFVHRGKALDLIDLKTGRATAVIESGKYGSYGRYGQYGQYGQVAAVERLAPGAIADPSGKQIYALVSGEGPAWRWSTSQPPR